MHVCDEQVRKLMISAVLATDMAFHGEMVKELSTAATEHTTSAIAPEFSLRVLCHVADLCNCAIRWQLSAEWARRVCAEAVNQAAREHALGFEVSKLTPYSDDELCTRQLVFLDGWVRPLFKAAAIIYPGAKGRLGAIQECREGCKAGMRKTNAPSAEA